jgi:hypothetical protein
MATDITLIFTKHKASGFCNPQSLLQIIEHVSPQVIFEELSVANYQKIYQEGTLITLESNAIKAYLQSHPIEHIPVDTFDIPKNYDADIDWMYKKVIEGTGQHSFHLRGLIEKQIGLASNYGFAFLNGVGNEKYYEEFYALKAEKLAELNDEKTNRIAALEQEVINKREETMLNNIYTHCKERDFTSALFFIGSGHMKSIKAKIEERESDSGDKIKWSYFSDLIKL